MLCALGGSTLVKGTQHRHWEQGEPSHPPPPRLSMAWGQMRPPTKPPVCAVWGWGFCKAGPGMRGLPSAPCPQQGKGG